VLFEPAAESVVASDGTDTGGFTSASDFGILLDETGLRMDGGDDGVAWAEEEAVGSTIVMGTRLRCCVPSTEGSASTIFMGTRRRVGGLTSTATAWKHYKRENLTKGMGKYFLLSFFQYTLDFYKFLLD
jgi:hypothetical protein